MAGTVQREEIVLVQGSSEPIRVVLVDANGNDENIAGWDAAVFTVREYIGATPVLVRSTVGGSPTLSVGFDAGNADPQDESTYLQAAITSVESAALAPGVYVAQAAVRFGSAASWKYTDEMRFRVKAAIALPENPP